MMKDLVTKYARCNYRIREAIQPIAPDPGRLVSDAQSMAIAQAR